MEQRTRDPTATDSLLDSFDRAVESARRVREEVRSSLIESTEQLKELDEHLQLQHARSTKPEPAAPAEELPLDPPVPAGPQDPQ